MKYLIMTPTVLALVLVCTGCKPDSENTQQAEPKASNVQADDAPINSKLWDDDPVGNRIAGLPAVLEMRKKVAKAKKEAGKDIGFPADRKAAGQPYTGQGMWALTMWPENASNYKIYKFSISTSKRWFPWQIFVVDPVTQKIYVIESRKTGNLISLEEWQEKKTCLYTIEDALADRFENYSDKLIQRDKRIREQNSPAAAGQ